MYGYRILGALALCLVPLGSAAQAQQVRSEVGLTVERHGAALDLDMSYYKKRVFGIVRIFIDEESRRDQERSVSRQPLMAEGGFGVLVRNGQTIVAPLAGIDTEKRFLVGSGLVTRLLGRNIAYLGYAKLSTEARREHVTRHRLLIDLKKDRGIFLRWDWKTEARDQAHSRLGVEFHTRWDRLNLPLYAEPFWNFVGKQVGVRVGTKL